MHDAPLPTAAGAPTAAHDLRLFRAFWAGREPRARDALVERYLPLAHSVALRFRLGDEPADDLKQVAVIGLINAVDRYDGRRGTSFATFAVPTIRGEIKRYLRDRTWAVRPPRDLLERALAVAKTTDTLTDEQGRGPTVPELRRALGPSWTDEQVLEALAAREARGSTSLQAPLRGDHEDAATLEEHLGDEDEGFARAELRAMLDRLLRIVPVREREVLHLRFGDDLTQAQVGRRLGISQMQVSRLQRTAIERMSKVALAGVAAPPGLAQRA